MKHENPSNAAASAEPVAVPSTELPKNDKTISVTAEIENAPIPDPIDEMIKRCQNCDSGTSLFKKSQEHIFKGLKEAYPLYLLVKDNETEHQRVIDALNAKGNRERAPSLKKPAYNTVVLSCHPDDPDDWSKCSDWQNVLLLADIEKVKPYDFPVWIAVQKIGESKRKVRAAKQFLRPLKTPFTQGDFPFLYALFKSCNEAHTRDAVKAELTTFETKLRKNWVEKSVSDFNG